MNKLIEIVVGLIPTSTLAAIVASLVTKALANIKDKEKALKVCSAASAVADAAKIASDAAKDCEITEDEVNDISASIQFAVKQIREAG